MSRETEKRSMYSDMSMRTMAFSLSNRNEASCLHSSVLPTPVGPKNRNEPSGLLCECSPAREIRTALLCVIEVGGGGEDRSGEPEFIIIIIREWRT
jgi:hypothetical protein